MADEQRRLPIFDYDVISDRKPEEPQPEDPKPGDQWPELVYEELPPPGSWKKGKQVGTVQIHAKGPEAPGEDPRFDADFTFTDPPDVSIKVDGKVPGNWVGKGKAHAKGEGREKDDVDIEFRNPKRW